MNFGQLGHSRTALRPDHFFQAPDSFVRAPLPGMRKGTAIVHAGPAMGARFTEYTAELERGGGLGPAVGERFFYVASGTIRVDGKKLASGGFCYVPQGERADVTALSKAHLVVIEKPYQSLGDCMPSGFIGQADAVAAIPLAGDEAVRVQPLVPDGIDYDFAVNLMTFDPGASLSMVEAHVMEHGLLMLAGAGIYRLGDCWYPTTAGDFIWMAPYCPQWFGALGKQPAQYLIYKDWNRHPL